MVVGWVVVPNVRTYGDSTALKGIRSFRYFQRAVVSLAVLESVSVPGLRSYYSLS